MKMETSLKKDDMGEIIHYGHTEVCFDLHPKQVQPEHIVITSPYFRTDERRIGKEGGMGGAYNKLQPASITQIIRLHDGGKSYKEVGEAMGISRKRALYYYKTYKKA